MAVNIDSSIVIGMRRRWRRASKRAVSQQRRQLRLRTSCSSSVTHSAARLCGAEGCAETAAGPGGCTRGAAAPPVTHSAIVGAEPAAKHVVKQRWSGRLAAEGMHIMLVLGWSLLDTVEFRMHAFVARHRCLYCLTALHACVACIGCRDLSS